MPSPRTPQLSITALELSSSIDHGQQLLSDPKTKGLTPNSAIEPLSISIASVLDTDNLAKSNPTTEYQKLSPNNQFKRQSQDHKRLMEASSENINDSLEQLEQERLEDDWGEDLDNEYDESDLNSDEFASELDVDSDEDLRPSTPDRKQRKSNRKRKSNRAHHEEIAASSDLKDGNNHTNNLDLLQVYRQSPTLKLRNCIVTQNLGLVRKEAYHWVNQCTETFDDLVQVGSIGLIRAIERFDMNRGHAFSSFAIPYIRGEIQHYLRDKSPTVRMPRNWLTLYNQGCKQIRLLRIQMRREPLDHEVANTLSITVSEWQEIKLACQNRSPVSLDTPLSDENDNPTFLGDIVTDQKYHSFQLAQEDSLRIQQALDLLEDRTRQIVEFVFLKEFTHREVAETLGISAVTVSRQLKKGLEVLRNVLTTPLE